MISTLFIVTISDLGSFFDFSVHFIEPTGQRISPRPIAHPIKTPSSLRSSGAPNSTFRAPAPRLA
jgi:hypothetical protein